jgi:D-methionine transport system substrate-binding protein
VGFKPTVADIVENPKAPPVHRDRRRPDPAFPRRRGRGGREHHYATPAGLKPGDAILREDPKGLRQPDRRSRPDKDKPWVRTLVECNRSPEVKAFIEKTFGGAVLASLVSGGARWDIRSVQRLRDDCVGHQSPGLWTHPRDRRPSTNTLPY